VLILLTSPGKLRQQILPLVEHGNNQWPLCALKCLEDEMVLAAKPIDLRQAGQSEGGNYLPTDQSFQASIESLAITFDLRPPPST